MAETVIIEYKVKDNGALEATRTLGNNIDDLGGKSKTAGKGLSSMSKIIAAVGFAALAKQAVQAGVAIAKMGVEAGIASLQVADSFNTMKIRLTNLRGSVVQAEKDFDWIKTFAVNTPLQVAMITDQFASLVAYGIEPTGGALQALTDVSFKYGKGAETLEAVILALGKAMGKGKMEAETWDMLAERSIPIQRLFSEALGVSSAKIMEMRTAGQLGREEIGKLIDYMGGEAAGSAAAMMNTLSGKISNVVDTVTNFMDTIGRGGMEGALEALTTLGLMLDDMEKNGTIDALAVSFGQFTGAVAEFAKILRDNSDVIGVFFTSLGAVGKVLADNFNKGVNLAVSGLKKLTGAEDDVTDASILMARSHKTNVERLEDLALQSTTALLAANALAESAANQKAVVDELNISLSEEDQAWQDVIDASREMLEAEEDLAFHEANQWAAQMAHDAEDLEAAMDSARKNGLQPLIDDFVDFLATAGAPPDMGKNWSEEFEVVGDSFTDLIGDVFAGNLDSFSDIWHGIWQSAAADMTKTLAVAFEDIFEEGGSLMDMAKKGWDAIVTEIQENPIGSAITGAGMVLDAREMERGMESVLTGMMGGAMTGASIGFMVGGPVGMAIGGAIGAIVGGALAYFGGQEGPSTQGYMRVGGDVQITGTGSQALPDGAWDLWEKERAEEYRAAERAWNGVLTLFNDGDLFSLLGDPNDWEFGGDGTLDEVAAMFREEIIPQAMRQIFEQAVNQGLGNLGVSEETLNRLWGEYDGMTGEAGLQGITNFVASMVILNDLMASMTWGAMLEEVDLNSMELFALGMGNIMDSINMGMVGFDSLTLMEQAEQALTIEELITSARTAEIEMLKQLDAMQKSINASLDQQIEGIQVGGMDKGEQMRYYQDQIASIMATLRSGSVTSPEELAQLIADLQRYTGAYQNVLGDDFYEPLYNSNQTPADEILALLGEARTISDGYFDVWKEEVSAYNEELLSVLNLLYEYLTGEEAPGPFAKPEDPDVTTKGGMLTPPNSVTETIQIPVSMTVNIAGDRSLFVKDVRSIVHAELRNRQAMTSPAVHGVS